MNGYTVLLLILLLGPLALISSGVRRKLFGGANRAKGLK